MNKKNSGIDDKVIYAPFTIIQGGISETDEQYNIEDVDKIQEELIYLVAKPTGICGAFTELPLVQDYIITHPDVQVMQLPKNKPLC